MRYTNRILITAAVCLISAITTAAQAEKPSYYSYRNVTIGMKTDEARKLLGDPKDKADDQDLYVFDENESAQLYYDANHSVSAISITFFGDLSKAPAPRLVLGEEIQPKPDGSMFKMVRYPKAGFWVSYSRTAGDSPVISITLQKI